MVWHCQSHRSGSHDLENTRPSQPINSKSNKKCVDLNIQNLNCIGIWCLVWPYVWHNYSSKGFIHEW